MTVALSWTRARPLGAGFAAVLAGAVLARYGLGAAGLIAAVTTAVLVVLSLIDFESHRLPNLIVLPSAALVLAAQLATSRSTGRRGSARASARSSASSSSL